MEYTECKFSTKEDNNVLEMKIQDYNIPKVEQFRYLDSIIRGDEEIDGNVTDRN